MNPRQLTVFVATLALLGVVGCKKSSSEDPAASLADPVDSAAPALVRLVVTQRTVVTTESDAKSKQIGSVQPGEVMDFLGDSVESTLGKNEQVYRVRLSDGSEGWARNYGLVLGTPGAVLSDAMLYQRPTLFSPSSQKLRLGQLVGVLGTQDEFVHVAASKWQSGWIEKRHLSTDPNDVLAAAILSTAIGKMTGKEALEAGLAALSGRTSAVSAALRAKLDSLESDVEAYPPAEPSAPDTAGIVPK